MGTLTIQEYERAANADYGASIQVGEEPPIKQQAVIIDSTERLSATLHPKTRLVTISTDDICKIEVDSNPVIGPASRRLPADLIGYPLGFPNNKELKIAVQEAI